MSIEVNYHCQDLQSASDVKHSILNLPIEDGKVRYFGILEVGSVTFLTPSQEVLCAIAEHCLSLAKELRLRDLREAATPAPARDGEVQVMEFAI